MAASIKWGCSSVGRAPALQAGGHEFESHHLHEGNEKSERACVHKISECACTNELIFERREVHSENARDERNEMKRIKCSRLRNCLNKKLYLEN